MEEAPFKPVRQDRPWSVPPRRASALGIGRGSRCRAARDGERLADDVGDRPFTAGDDGGSGAVDRVHRQRGRYAGSEETGLGDDPAVERADEAVRLRDVVDLEDTGEVRVRPLE